MNWQRAMAAVGAAVGLNALAQHDPRPLEFERTEIQPASELIHLGVSPFYRFVTRDGLVVGSYATPGGGATTFLQRADGSGFEPLGDLAPRGANSLGDVVGVVGGAGAVDRAGEPLQIVQDPSVSSSRLWGISDTGLAVGQAIMADGERPQPISFDRGGLSILPLPAGTRGATALAISPDGRTIVGVTRGASINDGVERVLVWRDGVVRETAISVPSFLSPYPSEVSDSGVLLLNAAFSIDPPGTKVFDLNADEELYADTFESFIFSGGLSPTQAAGVSEDGLIAHAPFEPLPFPSPQLGFTDFAGTTPFQTDSSLFSIQFLDWDITGTNLLTRESDGTSATSFLYSRIPSPGVPALFGGGALLATRRRR
ncbi:MAG: hypothetical protein AAFS11_03155 [Planctomycetota bacterium]